MFQPTGAFKVRGALNTALLAAERGQLTGTIKAVSSGNHAQAVAWASRILEQQAIVFMAKSASPYKISATQRLGAKVHLCATRSEADQQVKQLNDALFIPPFDHDDVIAGQGTACLEAFQQAGFFDAIFTPCGGGGLLSGTLIVARHLHPASLIFGVEPSTANDAQRSLATGQRFAFAETPATICDGIQTMSISERTFTYLRQVDAIFDASDTRALLWSQRLLQTHKLAVEPSSAIALAGVEDWLSTQSRPQKILVILSGGNIDQSLWRKIIEVAEPNLQP
jgi:threonine dehydratase